MKKTPDLADPAITGYVIAPYRRCGKLMPNVLYVIDTYGIS